MTHDIERFLSLGNDPFHAFARDERFPRGNFFVECSFEESRAQVVAQVPRQVTFRLGVNLDFL